MHTHCANCRPTIRPQRHSEPRMTVDEGNLASCAWAHFPCGFQVPILHPDSTVSPLTSSGQGVYVCLPVTCHLHCRQIDLGCFEAAAESMACNRGVLWAIESMACNRGVLWAIESMACNRGVLWASEGMTCN